MHESHYQCRVRYHLYSMILHSICRIAACESRCHMHDSIVKYLEHVTTSEHSAESRTLNLQMLLTGILSASLLFSRSVVSINNQRQPRIFPFLCFSTDYCCTTEHAGTPGFEGFQTKSINAERVPGAPMKVKFGCWDPRVDVKYVVRDPMNRLKIIPDQNQIIVLNGNEMHCDREWHVVFIISVLIDGETLSEGFCMFKNADLEKALLPTDHHDLAYFKALPQPVSVEVLADIEHYIMFVRAYNRRLEVETTRHMEQIEAGMREHPDHDAVVYVALDLRGPFESVPRRGH